MIKNGNVKCTDLGVNGKAQSDLELGPGDYFGERALMLDEPRAGNVYALDNVTLLALDRNNFENLLGPLRETLDYNLGIRVLKSVPLLGKLDQKERTKLVKLLAERSYKAGAFIIKQGEPGSEFFIVKTGELKVTASQSGVEVDIGTLAAGDYFGEQALQNDAPRAANVKAVSDVSVFVLGRKKFEEILGPLSAILERVIQARQAEVKDIVNKRSLDSDIRFNELKMLRTLGTGTFGRVKLVQHVKTGKVYALKCLQKAQVVAYKQESNVMNEKNLLMEAVHPFILQLITTYKDRNCLYMLLELVQGGEVN
jgi:cGMP-dependent protein kinase